jgi:hypothetical protein
VDMVNSLPNVARQLGRRGMVRKTSLRALSELCSERDSVLKDIVEFYGGLVDAAAQGVTARDRAKDLPIRILAYCTAVATRRGLRHRDCRSRVRCCRSSRNSRRSCESAGARSTRMCSGMMRRGCGGWRTTCVGRRRGGRVRERWRGRRRWRRRQSPEREAWLRGTEE